MASNKLTITDLEFDDIKSNLKSYLSAQSQFADYDFAGSGMDVLLDVLAYNTHYMGYYANMAVNEMFIDSYEWYCKNRQDILSGKLSGSGHKSAMKQKILRLVPYLI